MMRFWWFGSFLPFKPLFVAKTAIGEVSGHLYRNCEESLSFAAVLRWTNCPADITFMV